MKKLLALLLLSPSLSFGQTLVVTHGVVTEYTDNTPIPEGTEIVYRYYVDGNVLMAPISTEIVNGGVTVRIDITDLSAGWHDFCATASEVIAPDHLVESECSNNAPFRGKFLKPKHPHNPAVYVEEL